MDTPLSPVQVGGQVEVKQPDGHFQQANIVKLTDHSTYTVGECVWKYNLQQVLIGVPRECKVQSVCVLSGMGLVWVEGWL